MLKVFISLVAGAALAVLAIYALSLIFSGWALFIFQLAACFLIAPATIALLKAIS